MQDFKKSNPLQRNRLVASDSITTATATQDKETAKVWTTQEAYDDAWNRYQDDMAGSGIDTSLFINPNDTGIHGFKFVDSEDETEGAIWEFINYEKTSGNKRNGRQVPDYFAGWGIYQEDGSPWQCKPRRYRRNQHVQYYQFGAKYYAPAGIGNKALFLPVSVELRQRLSQQWNIDIPLRGSFWEWFKNNPKAKRIPVVVTEGAKKAAAGFQIGYPTISLFGCHAGTQKVVGDLQYKILTNELKPYCNGRKVVIAFDKDEKLKTIKTVEQATRKLCKAIGRDGGFPFIMKWHSSEGKGLDDLILTIGVNKVNKYYKSSVSIEAWDNEQLTRLRRVDKEVNSRYLGDALDIEEMKQHLYKHKVLAIKSQYGTGKSHTIAQLVSSIRDDNEKMSILNLTHRNKLGETTSKILGIAHGKGTKEQRATIEHQLARTLGRSICIDSLCPESEFGFDLFNQDWEDIYPNGLIIIIDEIEQFLNHLLDSSTCKHRRLSIIEQFLALLGLIRERVNVLLITADNDLGNRSMNFLGQALNNGYEEEDHIHPYIIQNNYNREIERIAYQYDYREDLLRRIMIGLQLEEKQLIHTASIQSKYPFSSINLEEHILKVFPNKRILRIDADTVIDPDHPAFGCADGQKLNEVVHQYDVIIASPVIETGISLEPNGYLDAVFGFFQGVQTVNSVCQTIERCRDNIPRHIWVNDNTQLHRDDATYAKKSYYELINYTKDRTKVNQKMVDCPAVQLIDDEYPFLRETWAAFKSEQVWMIQDYRNHVYRKMEGENGYTFHNPDDDPFPRKDRETKEIDEDFQSSEELLEEHRVVVEESQEKRRGRTINAEDLPDDKYKILFNQRKKTETQRRALDKYHIKNVFCLRKNEELTEDHIKQYDKGVVDGWYNYYYITKGEEFLETINYERVKSICKDGKAFSVDVNKQSIYLKITLLKQALIPFMEKVGENLTSGQISDLYLEHLVKNKAVRTALFKFLNVRLSDNAEQATRTLKALLARLGFALKCTGRKKGQQRTYMITVPNDGREEVLQRWYERDVIKYKSVLAG